MVLASKVREVDNCGCEAVSVQIPEAVKELFDEPLFLAPGQRQLLVTLGQFSIVRLERDAQLVVPVTDYAIPCKECCDSPGGGEDPCEMFSRIPFPANEFSPRNCDEEHDSQNKPC